MQCGEPLLSEPRMEAPPSVKGEAPAPAPLPPPAAMGARDYRPHLTVGALLAFVATLVVPPLTGGVAMLLGYWAYAHGNPDEKRKGLLVMLAGLVGMSIGLAISLLVERAGLLPA